MLTLCTKPDGSSAGRRNGPTYFLPKFMTALAAKPGPIGDGAEFWEAVGDYVAMLDGVDDRLPYP